MLCLNLRHPTRAITPPRSSPLRRAHSLTVQSAPSAPLTPIHLAAFAPSVALRQVADLGLTWTWSLKVWYLFPVLARFRHSDWVFRLAFILAYLCFLLIEVRGSEAGSPC